MENTIDLQEFLATKRIQHSETASDYLTGIQFLVDNNNNADIVTYIYTKHLSLFGTSFLEIDNEGHHFYEYSIERIGDIVDNMSVESLTNLNVQISYNIGGIMYNSDQFKEFVFISAPFQELKVRITFFEKPNLNDEIKILSRYYLINIEDRQVLAKSRVNTENSIYNYAKAT